MRLLNTLFVVMALAPVAAAHTLDGDATLSEELGHQFSSAHHVPLLLMVIVAALFISRNLGRNKSQRRPHKS